MKCIVSLGIEQLCPRQKKFADHSKITLLLFFIQQNMRL